VWPLVLWEPAIGWAVSGVAALVGLAAAGFGGHVLLGGLILHTVAWLAAEAWFLAGRGLAFGPRAAAAAIVREALAPLLMLRALSGRRIDWRGNDLGGQWRGHSRGTGPRGTPV